jgi:hypothetical protein
VAADRRIDRPAVRTHWTRLVDGGEHLPLSDRLRRFEESAEGRVDPDHMESSTVRIFWNLLGD